MRQFHLISVLGVLAAALASSMLAANDWPQWRGPLRDDLSTETGLLKKWPADGPPLAWKISGVGGGFSGVSLQGDRIFTMGDGADESFIYALNRADGKLLWSAKVGKPGEEAAIRDPAARRPPMATVSMPWVSRGTWFAWTRPRAKNNGAKI